jgi:hypothetical protein
VERGVGRFYGARPGAVAVIAPAQQPPQFKPDLTRPLLSRRPGRTTRFALTGWLGHWRRLRARLGSSGPRQTAPSTGPASEQQRQLCFRAGAADQHIFHAEVGGANPLNGAADSPPRTPHCPKGPEIDGRARRIEFLFVNTGSTRSAFFTDRSKIFVFSLGGILTFPSSAMTSITAGTWSARGPSGPSTPTPARCPSGSPCRRAAASA